MNIEFDVANFRKSNSENCTKCKGTYDTIKIDDLSISILQYIHIAILICIVNLRT